MHSVVSIEHWMVGMNALKNQSRQSYKGKRRMEIGFIL
jgi:hypothetical protein